MESGKYLWVLKATGLGITEFMLRYICWKCETDPTYNRGEVVIIVGPNQELAIRLIDRIKAFYEKPFDSKNTVVELNGCHIEAYPSHHLDAARSLTNVRFVLLDEADFFPIGQQEDARKVSERYIAKSNPHIVMISTPGNPGGLFETMEKEEPSLYKKIKLNYTVGMPKDGKKGIYDPEEIKIQMGTPHFKQEYELQYGVGEGNIFPYQIVNDITETYDLGIKEGERGLFIDPAYGSSKFAILGAEMLDDIIYIKEATEYERASPSHMVEIVAQKAKIFGSMVMVDSAHPGLIQDLSDKNVQARPVVFGQKMDTGTLASEMTVIAAQMVKDKKVRIHPIYKDLLAQLKAAKFNDKGKVDKTSLNFDLGDTFIMACYYLHRSEPFLIQC